MILNGLTIREIAQRLEAEPAEGSVGHELAGSCRRPPTSAAVLLPLFHQAASWHLLYIRRAEQTRDRHSGEVAFPGGCAEEADAGPAATALREAREEIGLEADQVEVLGCMRPLRTVSNFLVTPVVGHIRWPMDLRPDPIEVAHVFSLPLDWLQDPRNRAVRVWPRADHPQAREVVFFEEFGGERLWGVSARITLDFLACLT